MTPPPPPPSSFPPRPQINASRALFTEVNKRFPTLPFTMRAIEDKKARLGLVECLKHDLLTPLILTPQKFTDYVFKLNGLSKGNLTEPQLSPEISNDACAQRIHQRFAGTDIERLSELNQLSQLSPDSLAMATLKAVHGFLTHHLPCSQ